MRGDEFIKMMYQDIETHPDREALAQVVEVMEHCVQQNPLCDIDPKDKTPEGCFNAMRNYAEKNRNGKRHYYFGPSASIKFVSEYLGLAASSAGGTPAPGGIVDLESFF